MKPEDSLIMRNEDLSTIPEKESDEFIKSSVEDYAPIPSEFEDASGSDKNIESKDSYVSNLDEPALLVTPLSDFNKDECFDPGGDVDEIELLLHHNTPTPKMRVVSILEGFTNEPPLEENDDLFDLESKENVWKKILYNAPIDDLMTEDKVFDPEILEKIFSPTYVSLPFEDRHYLSLTYVIRIFLPYLTYSKDSSLLLSSRSEDTIFDLDISIFSCYSLELVVKRIENEAKTLNQQEKAANVSTHTPEPSRRFNIIYDDDEESTIPLNEITSQIPPITPVLPTMEPEDSLIMRNEELSTIPKKESDEFIKSSVEDLVPIPSESEDTFESDGECDLSSCDDFSPIDVPEGKSVTFSNPLFDSNDDFTSSDDESLSDEDVPEDNVKIYSNPLFEFDDEYISSDVNPHFDEVFVSRVFIKVMVIKYSRALYKKNLVFENLSKLIGPRCRA
ncbi:hypothetical protein Tco_1338217 [Tanacetum coccineum]